MRGAALRPLRCEKHRHNFSSLDELEKSPARGHVMSLTMRVKLTDCFLLLCPRTLLLPHSSHVSLSLSLVFRTSPFTSPTPLDPALVFMRLGTPQRAGSVVRPDGCTQHARRATSSRTVRQCMCIKHGQGWILVFHAALIQATQTRSRDHSIAFQAQLRMTYI